MNILLNLWLIPKHSYLAASYTTVFTEAAGFTANFLFVTRNIVRVNTAGPMLKAGAGSLLMAAVLLVVKDYNLVLLVVLGAAVYFGFLFLSGAIDAEDRRVLADVFFRGA